METGSKFHLARADVEKRKRREARYTLVLVAALSLALGAALFFKYSNALTFFTLFLIPLASITGLFFVQRKNAKAWDRYKESAETDSRAEKEQETQARIAAARESGALDQFKRPPEND